MADRKMIYDFETSLRTLLDAHQDLIGILTQWSAMLDSRARYVDFTLHDGTSLHTPNIQMIVDTINERTLPSDPSFRSVTATGPNGVGTLTRGSLHFEGASSGETIGATYGAYGVEGCVMKIEDSGTIMLQEWPLPRYWEGVAGGDYTVSVSPDSIGDTAARHASDFFVYLPANTKLTIYFPTTGGHQTITLQATSGRGVWHVVYFIKISGSTREVFASATKMGVV